MSFRSLDKAGVIEQLTALEETFDLKRSEYWVEAGGVLVLYGIRQLTYDVDITVTREVFDRITHVENKDLPYFQHPAIGERGPVTGFGFDLVDVHCEREIEVTPETIVVEGVRCVKLEHVALMKQQMGRPKDVADVLMIREYLEQVK